ncbi:thermonuclease family protein [Rothia sp. P13129]|uniref:thermonuclease family protein n=1 Tax=Rothia sp. P13129 TaxID=3402664 RepID=UPI003AD1FD1E
MKITRTFVLSGVALLALSGCSSATPQPEPSPSSSKISYADGLHAKVLSVETANTITVDVDGRTKEVRLLNVVAPTEHNNEFSGSCLVPESTEFLKQKLPEGTEVTLDFDDSRVGSSGYLEAAVYVGDDLINADVVREGFATTTFLSQRDEHYAPVSEAQQEAAREGRGIYSKDVECSLPHAIQLHLDRVHRADDSQNEEERVGLYKSASNFYNTLMSEAKSPDTWVGSIVTLDAVKDQLKELKNALGKNYYDVQGKSEREKQSEANEPIRPGS